MTDTFQNHGINIPFSKTHGQVKTFCPQCHEKRSNKHDRSLSVDIDKGVWNCHYCGWSGGLNAADPWKVAAPARRLKNSKPEYRKPEPRTCPPMEPRALKWFKGRGISEETLVRMKVTEGPEWMPQKNGVANTVQFNYFLGGELVNTKFRTGDKCFKLVQGAELLPYNIDSILGTKECVITEGEMDALSFIECGRTDVVSVPNGANANLTYLDEYLEKYFDDKETVYIASDTDTKGVLLRDELLRRFGPERCRVVDYGDDCKDANEHLQKYGKESLLDCLRNAPETKVEGIFTVSDFEQSLDYLFDNGLQRGVLIGHPNLDDIISFETKRLCIVTGVPGSGKSEFIDEMAERLNIRYNWRFAYFSPENAPLAYHASKLVEKFTGRKFGREWLSSSEYRQVKEHLEKNFFFISPSENFRLDTILEKAKVLVRRKGIKALVIDPYNRLESEQGRMNETQYISMVLDKLTNFAQMNDVLMILMAHPTKQQRNKEGVIEPPTLYDISGSANFYNKADFGIVVHRDYAEEVTRVLVQKVKFRHLGRNGEAVFKYNLNNGRYTPYREGETPEWDNTNHLLTRMREMEEVNSRSSLFDYSPEFDPDAADCPF